MKMDTEENIPVSTTEETTPAPEVKTQEDTLILSFKAIHGFVMSLADEFKSKQHSLALYARLIEKTTFSHTAAMQKHVASFAKFCIRNKNAFENQDNSNLAEHKIQYSERVFINMNHIFKLADADTRRVIWAHLLTIAALVNPSSQAKKHLVKFKETKEGDFLTNFVSQIEDQVSTSDIDTTDPMNAIGQIMNSGMLDNLMSGLTSGDADGLDIGKLMGMAQGLLSQLGGENAGGIDLSALMGSIGGNNIDIEALTVKSKEPVDEVD